MRLLSSRNLIGNDEKCGDKLEEPSFPRFASCELLQIVAQALCVLLESESLLQPLQPKSSCNKDPPGNPEICKNSNEILQLEVFI